jgi:hypothetical protein
MLASTLLLLTTGATLVLHVEEKIGVSQEDLDASLQGLKSAITARTGPIDVVLTSAAQLVCSDRAACVEEIRSQRGGVEIVFLRVLGIPSTIRMIAERAGREGKSHVDLERKQPFDATALDALAAELFPERVEPPLAAKPAAIPPEGPRPDLVATSAPATPAPSGPRLLPWALLGGSAVAAGLGLAFGFQNAHVVREGEATFDPARRAQLQGETFSTGLAADILFGVAIVGAVAAGVAFVDP